MIFYKLIKIICVRYELLFFFILSIFLFFKNAEYKQKNSFDKLKEVNKWIYKCQNEILIRGILKSFKKPKISALITLYNSQNSIQTAVRSIQNQYFEDIEILIVDDFSSDNSSNIIKDLQREDGRIKIIKNKKNRGALYAKSIGILKSNGIYTMILDSDDLFANENIFNICYEISIQNNIDIVEFSGYYLNSTYLQLDVMPEIPYYLRFKEDNEFISQPDLSYFIYKKNGVNDFRLIDGVLWGKCIKTNIFKMALKIVGNNVYRQKINYGDDRIINFILFKVANSFKYIKEYGIIYNFNNKSITHLNTYIDHCHDELINIMSIYNYTKNSKETELAAFEIIFRWKSIIFPGMDLYNFQYTKLLINELLKNQYVCYHNKLKLLYLYQNLTESKRLNLFTQQ